MNRALLVLLVLGGCSSSPSTGPRPPRGFPVEAKDGGTAVLTLTSCPVRVTGGEAVTGLIQSLVSQGTIVSASDGGTARLILNTCPHEAAFPAAVELERIAGQRRR